MAEYLTPRTMGRTKFWMLALFTLQSATIGCISYPKLYNKTFSGFVNDEEGRPVSGAHVIIRVMKECGTVGGLVRPLEDTVTTLTDKQGRYNKRVFGVGWMTQTMFSGCVGYSFLKYACKAGYAPATFQTDASSVTLPNGLFGRGWIAQLETPDDCKKLCSGKHDFESKIPSWEPGYGITVHFQSKAGSECPYPERPSVEAHAYGVLNWIRVDEIQYKDGRIQLRAEPLVSGPTNDTISETYWSNPAPPGDSLLLRSVVYAFRYVGPLKKGTIVVPVGGFSWELAEGSGAMPNYRLLAASQEDWQNHKDVVAKSVLDRGYNSWKIEEPKFQ